MSHPVLLLSNGETLYILGASSLLRTLFLFVWIRRISALSSIFLVETEWSSEGEASSPCFYDVDEVYIQSSAKEPGEHVCFELRHCFAKGGMCVLSHVCITETKHLMWPISDFIQVFHHSAHLLYTKHFPFNSVQSYSHTVLFHTSCISWTVDKLFHGAILLMARWCSV